MPPSPKRRDVNKMTDTAKETALSAYRAQFDELGGSPSPDWLADRRRAAMGRFEALGLPFIPPEQRNAMRLRWEVKKMLAGREA